MKKLTGLALGFGLLSSAANAQTAVQWGYATGSNPRSLQVRDQTGAWITLGSVDSTAHTAGISSLIPGTASGNIGTLTGALAGSTLPATAIASNYITNAMLQAGVASANIGTLTGALAGSVLPATTIASGYVTNSMLASGVALANLGFTPLNIAGGTMTGKLLTNPSGSGSAGLNLGVGTAPSSPVNGDMWVTSAGAFVQANGVTQTIAAPPVGTSGTVLCYLSSSCTYSAPLIINVGGSGIQTVDGAGLLTQNTSKTALQIYSSIVPPGWFFYGTTRSILDLELGTAVQGGAAYDAYIYDNVPTGSAGHEANAVGFFVNGVNAVAGAKQFGINTSGGDSIDNTTLNSVASTIVGYEADFTVYNTGTIVEGISELIQGTAQPSSAAAFQVGAVSGATAQWTNGFITNNGAVLKAMSIGALSTSGSNISGQPINLNVFDSSSAAHAVVIQAEPAGTNSAIQFSDNIRANGITMLMAATGGAPQITASGSDANINFVISGKGSGNIAVLSNVIPAITATFSLGASGISYTDVYATTYHSGASVGVSKTCGATIVVTGGIITSC